MIILLISIVLTGFWLLIFIFNLFFFGGILEQDPPTSFPYSWSEFPKQFFVILIGHSLVLSVVVKIIFS